MFDWHLTDHTAGHLTAHDRSGDEAGDGRQQIAGTNEVRDGAFIQCPCDNGRLIPERDQAQGQRDGEIEEDRALTLSTGDEN